MKDSEIRDELKRFSERIFNIESISEAYVIKDEYDTFCKENCVSAEQLQEFAESGAGEMLYVLTHYR